MYGECHFPADENLTGRRQAEENYMFWIIKTISILHLGEMMTVIAMPTQACYCGLLWQQPRGHSITLMNINPPIPQNRLQLTVHRMAPYPPIITAERHVLLKMTPMQYS